MGAKHWHKKFKPFASSISDLQLMQKALEGLPKLSTFSTESLHVT